MDNEKYLDIINQGISLMSVGHYEKACDYFKAAIEVDKHSKDAYMHLGNAYANMERFDEALVMFDKVKMIDVDDAENYFSIGNVYVLKDNLLKAVENYNKAEDKGFKQEELYSNLAGIYRELGENQQALRNLTKAIRVAPLKGDIRVEKASIYIEMGKFNEALETLEELQKVIPDAFEAYDLQTQIYCGLGQHEKALEIITAAVEKFDKDVVLKQIKIKVLVEMGQFDAAKLEIAEIKQSPDFKFVARDVAVQESIMCSTGGDISGAAKALESALAYEEDGEIDEQCRYLLMNIYAGTNNYEKALEMATVLEKSDSETLFSVSGMYYKPYMWKMMGKTNEAKARFKELVSVFRKMSISYPSFYELYMYRLLCHVEVAEYDNALQLADYIENLYPDRADAFALRYTIYTEMGNKDEAEKNKIKAKSLNPNLNI